MLCWQCGEEIESRCTFDKCTLVKIENDFQLSMKIGAYYKSPKQIEPKVAVSYHRSLHFQMEHSYQSVLFRNPFESQRKVRLSLQMTISLRDIVADTAKRKPIRNASVSKKSSPPSFANDYITWLPYD